ncbi:helix-hairpin-helix domain-containing protein [Burkholderia sp. MR1-5-21]
MLPVGVKLNDRDTFVEGDTTAELVRLGFSLLHGMRQEAAPRIELARAARPFADVTDPSRRALVRDAGGRDRPEERDRPETEADPKPPVGL